MKNLRIGAKLSVTFAIAILALVGLSIFSVAKLGTMNDRVTYMAVDQRDKQVAIGEITSATANYRNDQAMVILLADPAEIRRALADMGSEVARLDRNVAFLNGSLKSQGSRVALTQLSSEWHTFLERAERTTALAAANHDEQALASFRAEAKSFAAVGRAGATLVQAQTANAREKLADAHGTFTMARALTIGLSLAVVALLSVLLITLIRSIAKPIAAVTVALGDLARGKMDAAVPVVSSRDEVGDLAKAMTGLRDQLAAAEQAKQAQTALIVDSIGTGLSALAAGDLTARIETDLSGPFAKLKTDFNDAMAAMAGTMSSVSEAAAGINNGASDIRQASDDLAQRTEQQAASLEETAAAMDQITSTVRETANGANRANEVVAETRVEAEQSGEVVRRAVEAMGGIERSAAEISDIISVIDGIAFQTNLLALNAGVEAARAGDAGKGFAVVASEVRALAQRSAEAAKDVKTRIVASGEQVEAGVQLVSRTGAALERIIGRIGEISALVDQIASSAEQQATGLQQVNTAVGEMDGVTQQNAAMVEEATAAARSLAAEVDAMSQQLGRFRTGAAPLALAAAPTPIRAARGRSAGPRLVTNGNAALAADDWSDF